MILESGAELSAARNSYSNYNLQQLNYSYNYSWYCYWGRCWRFPDNWIADINPPIHRPSTAPSSYVVVTQKEAVQQSHSDIANLDDVATIVEDNSSAVGSTGSSCATAAPPRRRWGRWKDK